MDTMDEDTAEKKRRQARQRMQRYRERLSQDSKKRFDEENQHQQHLGLQPLTQTQPYTTGQSASARYKARKRAQETTSERQARLAANAQNQARRRAQQSTLELEIRLSSISQAHEETTTEREARLAANAQSQRQRRSFFTQEHVQQICL